VRLLPFEEAESISGYPPGGTPSIGHRTQMQTLFCGGGSRDRLLEVRVEDVIRLNSAVVAPISRAD
jgi:prolyl-tRNA editing enzyme YbaK/EbsC (Cys-tRNA(Pro) deacylase)